MKGASFVIPLSWSDRVNQIEAQRAVQAQKMTLVGLGQPVDPLIWPIPDRFHALGIPTRGSCEGHWIPYSQRPLNPFVTVHGDPALRHQWLAIVESFLAPPLINTAEVTLIRIGNAARWYVTATNGIHGNSATVQTFWKAPQGG